MFQTLKSCGVVMSLGSAQQSISLHMEHLEILQILKRVMPVRGNLSRVVQLSLREMGYYYSDAHPELLPVLKRCDEAHGVVELNPWNGTDNAGQEDDED